MEIKFDKYQGAGNDFILIDNREGQYSNLETEQFKYLCNRYTGIGADGIILVEETPDADFEMRYFNADGRQSTLCGNGGRCTVAFAKRNQIIGRETCFKAIDGLHRASLISTDEVRLQMQNVNLISRYGEARVTDTGSPHYVQLVEDTSSVNVKEEGAAIRYSDAFIPDGINVNFLEKQSDSRFLIRTYERGVEDETLACGTGAVASALVMHHLGQTQGLTKIELEAIGGTLIVEFEISQQGYHKIYLQGPATFVFSGIINL